jgi:hypothetical protein
VGVQGFRRPGEDDVEVQGGGGRCVHLSSKIIRRSPIWFVGRSE